MSEISPHYRAAGVDIDAGDALIERIKPHAASTMRPEVLTGLGGFARLFRFPADMAEVAVDVNRLDNQILVRYYEAEWRRWEQ